MSAQETIPVGSSLKLASDLVLSFVLGPGGAFPEQDKMLQLPKGKIVTVTKNHRPNQSEIEFSVSGTSGTFFAPPGYFERS
ncbi:MAG: hypothetical protein WCG28_01730 [bacterium]